MTEKNKENQVGVVKSLNEELMQATYVALVPEEIDLHEHVISESEVRKSCHNFNKFCKQANLFHLNQTDTFEFAESYIAPVDMYLDDKFIKKGTWLVVVQALDEKLWELMKSGEICAVSIGALGRLDTIE